MKKLSRQPDTYLFFELARLRTLWVNNVGIRDRVENRYREVKGEFVGRGLNFTLNEHELDTVLCKREEEQNREIVCKVVAVEKAKHKISPLKGEEIDGVYEYTLSENGKVLGKTVGSQMVANVGEKLIVKRVDDNLFGVVSKVENIVKETVDGHEGKWVTVRGSHIFIRDGDTLEQTLIRMKEQPKPPEGREEWKYYDEGLKTLNPKEELKDKAKKRFGTTEDFREVGFIMEDGSMLDFGKEGRKTIEHDRVIEVIDTEKDENLLYDISMADSRRFFEKQTNSIRFKNTDNYSAVLVDINTHQDITEEQWGKIKEATFTSYKNNFNSVFIYNVNNKKFNSVRNGEIKIQGQPNKVVNKLKSVFSYEKQKESISKSIGVDMFNVLLDKFYRKELNIGNNNVSAETESEQSMMKEEGKWITLDNGQHVFVREGETVNDAIGRLKEKPDSGEKLNKPTNDINQHISDSVKRDIGYLDIDGDLNSFRSQVRDKLQQKLDNGFTSIGGEQYVDEYGHWIKDKVSSGYRDKKLEASGEERVYYRNQKNQIKRELETTMRNIVDDEAIKLVSQDKYKGKRIYAQTVDGDKTFN